MRIAICDKDNIFSIKLKQALYSYSNLHNLDFFIEVFNSGEKLLHSKNKYNLIFIEYTLSGINGLETVKEMRRQNNNTKIIFLTTNTKFIFEAFKVNTYRFLTKPLKKDILYKTLDDYFKESHSHYALLVNDGINTLCIYTDEIFYLEANNKYCFIHLENKTILCKKTMARVFEVLPKFYFQKINRAYIVNLNLINKYNSENVSLKNGKTLRITRTNLKIFKQKYTDFINSLIP